MHNSFAGMEVAVSPSAPQASWTSTYKAIIEQMLNKAEDIGDKLYNSEEKDMAGLVQELHNLTQFGRQFSFLAAMKYASNKGDSDIIDAVFRHPLLKVVHMYLATIEANDGIYLDWFIEKLERKPKWWERRVEIMYKINYNITRNNPYSGSNSPMVVQSERGDSIPIPYPHAPVEVKQTKLSMNDSE